jgi:hypothetical protein
MYTSIIAGRAPCSRSELVQHKMFRMTHLVLFFAAALTAIHAHSEEHQRAATVQYQTERDNCLNGHTNEDKKTCLKEAGAALEANRRGQLTDDNTQYHKNATLRCQALGADNRDACLRRMQGEGSVSGSAGSGGIFRELVTPIPDTHEVPASSDSGKKIDSANFSLPDSSK